jgi:transposase-like protein/transposase Tn5 family protein
MHDHEYFEESSKGDLGAMVAMGVSGQDGHREWAEEQFGEAELGDVRRVDRAVMIAEAMAISPSASIPQLFARPYDVKAAYAFFRHWETTPDALQAGHRELTLEQMRRPGVYLQIEDTSDLSWSGSLPIRGLGPIGNSAQGLQGFQLHSVLGVRWSAEAEAAGRRRPPVEVLGLCDQLYDVRRGRPEGEPSSSQARKYRDRASEVWTRAGRRIGPTPEGEDVRWIRVCDRGADIYEQLIECKELGHGYRIRAAQDRAVLDPQTGRSAGQLFTWAREAPTLGAFDLEVRARAGQAARTARLSVSARRVLIRSPWRPGFSPGKLEPVECTVVRVWEARPGREVTDPLEWFLLADEPIEGFEQALECALQYAARWIVEEFHKVLKSGLGAERLQLESAEALFSAISIKSVVAMRVLDLKERVRLIPDSPAEEASLSAEELEVLRAHTRKPVTTVREVALAVGRMGGHLNRKGDGMPGWQTLSRGMEKLLLLVEGVRLARKLKRFG